MTRGTKIGGGALVLAIVCLAGWYLTWQAEGVWSIGRVFRFSSKRLGSVRASPSPRMAALPKIYLWAWERSEDLKFLGDRKVGVAFLAKTIYVRGRAEEPGAEETAHVAVHPRMQPLRIVPGTALMAVVRIESFAGAVSPAYESGSRPALTYSEALVRRIASEIVETTNFPGVSGVQIDFDATLSEHDFYRALLAEVRKRLRGEIPLNITALASWCIGDPWLEQLPPGTIDEAVPMLFRMGAGEREIVNYVSSGEGFRVTACGGSIGISTDETFSRDILSGKISTGRSSRETERIYVFSPRAWDQAHAETTLEEIRTWRAN